jgi:hypothetical protein
VYKKNKIFGRLNAAQRLEAEQQIEAIAENLWMKFVYITHSKFQGSLKGLVAQRQMSMVCLWLCLPH